MQNPISHSGSNMFFIYKPFERCFTNSGFNGNIGQSWSYKVTKVRNNRPMIRQSRRDLPKDITNSQYLEVLRYDYKKEKMRIGERRS